jgi:peptide/nickel transport system ATP-binding protein
MNTDTESPLLEIQALCRSFGMRRGLFGGSGTKLPAVDDVSLSVRRGEIFGLAGESGSGKSTLARLLAQVLKPDAGRILLDGQPLELMGAQARREARRRIQMIFQDPSAALSPRRTIRQSLVEPLLHFGIGSTSGHEEMAVHSLAAVGLDRSALERLPHQFSSGQRQRIGIARALMAEPDLVIADEAVSSLDVSVQAQILELMSRLRERHGIAFLFISHDLAVIRVLADTVGVMFGGQLVESGPADALFSRPAHPYTRQLLAAVPDPDPGTTAALSPPPSGFGRATPATGCAFAHRCPEAMGHCVSRRPQTLPASGGETHRVKCHLYETAGAEP